MELIVKRYIFILVMWNTLMWNNVWNVLQGLGWAQTTRIGWHNMWTAPYFNDSSSGADIFLCGSGIFGCPVFFVCLWSGLAKCSHVWTAGGHQVGGSRLMYWGQGRQVEQVRGGHLPCRTGGLARWNWFAGFVGIGSGWIGQGSSTGWSLWRTPAW